MALIQFYEMEHVVENIVKAVRAKAAEFGLKNGAIAICYNNTPAYSKKVGPISFEELEPGEDRIRVFQLSPGGSHIVRDESGNDAYQCFGIVANKIAAAAKAYRKSGGACLLSSEAEEGDNIPGRINWGGCVLYPIYLNHNHCANIYVSVSGGTDEEDEECAWAALGPIRHTLLGCYPNIPSKYNRNHV